MARSFPKQSRTTKDRPMLHARTDYQRIQDPAGLIPEDEPVFLLRAQDIIAPDVVRHWAYMAKQLYTSDADVPKMAHLCNLAMTHAVRMEAWQAEHRAKVPDVPEHEQEVSEIAEFDFPAGHIGRWIASAARELQKENNPKMRQAAAYLYCALHELKAPAQPSQV